MKALSVTDGCSGFTIRLILQPQGLAVVRPAALSPLMVSLRTSRRPGLGLGGVLRPRRATSSAEADPAASQCSRDLACLINGHSVRAGALRPLFPVHVGHRVPRGVVHAPAASRAGDGPRRRKTARHDARTSQEHHIGKCGTVQSPIVRFTVRIDRCPQPVPMLRVCCVPSTRTPNSETEPCPSRPWAGFFLRGPGSSSLPLRPNHPGEERLHRGRCLLVRRRALW